MPAIFVSDIQLVVAREMNAPLSCMTERDGSQGQRRPDHVVPRQVAMSIAARLTNHGPTKLGRLFGGRDHSTVHHALKQIDERRACDAEFDAQMRSIMLKVLEGA